MSKLSQSFQLSLIVYWSHSILLIVHALVFIIAMVVKFQPNDPYNDLATIFIGLLVYCLACIGFIYGFWHRIKCLMATSLAFEIAWFALIIGVVLRFGVNIGLAYQQLIDISQNRTQTTPPKFPIANVEQLSEQCFNYYEQKVLKVVINLKDPLIVILISYLSILLLAIIANVSLIIQRRRNEKNRGDTSQHSLLLPITDDENKA